MNGKEDVVRIYNGILLSPIQRNKIKSVEVMWMKLEPVIESEVSKKRKPNVVDSHTCAESRKMVLMSLFAG